MLVRALWLTVFVAVFLVGCAPTLSSKPIAAKPTPPFKSGEHWYLYAGGSNVGNGDNLMLSVQAAPQQNRENNFYYTVGSASSKSSYFYYYPEQDALAVYVFSDKGSSSASREALLCFTYYNGNAWTGFWLVSTTDKIQQVVERDNITPQGSCSLNLQ